MTEYAHVVPAGLRANDPDRFQAEGAIEYAKGHYADAVKAFNTTRIENDCATCGLYRSRGDVH